MKVNLAKALEKPTSLAYAVSAEIQAREGRYDEAFAAIDKAMSLAPSDPENYIAKAEILNATGRAAEAEQAACTAIPGAKNLSLPTGLSKAALAKVAGKEDEIVSSCMGKYCPYSAYASAKAALSGIPRMNLQSSSSNAFASFRTGVSKPSVNQP